MIIKIIPIKTKVKLANALRYIAIDKGKIEDYRKQGIFHNIKNIELNDILNEFETNYENYGAKRSNGNIALQVILSMNPMDRQHLDISKMDDIMQTFLDKAYPTALGFSTHHLTDLHIHSHAIISGNGLMDKKSTRLSKSKLFELHKEMLNYIKKYPELNSRIDMSRWGKKLNTEKAYYMKKRHPTLTLSIEELRLRIQDTFRTCESTKQFFNVLEFDGFKTYTYKGRIQGISFGEDDKKIRFSRLGIEQGQLKALDKQFERLQDLEKLINPEKPLSLDFYQREEIVDLSSSPNPIYSQEQTEKSEEIERLNELSGFNEWTKEMELRQFEDQLEIENGLNDSDEKNEQIENDKANDIPTIDQPDFIDLDIDYDLDSEL